jgi:UDP-N-acetylmuramate dehydrogenase
MILLHDIQRQLRGSLRINEPLAPYTALQVGGPADYWFEPASKEELVQAVRYFQEHGIPVLLLTHGCNVLVSDEGYRGAVLSVDKALSQIHLEEVRSDGSERRVSIDAGVRVSRFVEFCVEQSLQGPEVLAGSAGTVGGWAEVNLRRAEGPLADHVVEIEVLRHGSLMRLRPAGRETPGRIDLNGDAILAATFQLPRGKKVDLMRDRRDWLVRRNAEEPINLANTGKVFKDPPGIRAAKLIAEAGMQGKRRGRAQVSERNANAIVTGYGAKAAEVLALIELMRRAVRNHSGVSLELQVKLVGFEGSTNTTPI